MTKGWEVFPGAMFEGRGASCLQWGGGRTAPRGECSAMQSGGPETRNAGNAGALSEDAYK